MKQVAFFFSLIFALCIPKADSSGDFDPQNFSLKCSSMRFGYLTVGGKWVFNQRVQNIHYKISVNKQEVVEENETQAGPIKTSRSSLSSTVSSKNIGGTKVYLWFAVDSRGVEWLYKLYMHKSGRPFKLQKGKDLINGEYSSYLEYM